MTTHEVLVRARNLIDREGHIKGWARTPDGYCALGACRFAGSSDGSNRLTAAAGRAVKQLGRTVGRASGGIATWNDEPERTKEEVLAAFDRAIAATAPPPADPFTTEREEAPVAV